MQPAFSMFFTAFFQPCSQLVLALGPGKKPVGQRAEINRFRGEFIVALPITVAIALSVSFLVAMVLTPALCYTFIRHGLKGQGGSLGVRLLGLTQGAYRSLIGPIVRRPALSLAAAALSLPAGLLLLPAIKQKFFPTAERAQFVIEQYVLVVEAAT